MQWHLRKTQKIPFSLDLIMPSCPGATRAGSEDGLPVTQFCVTEFDGVGLTVVQTP